MKAGGYRVGAATGCCATARVAMPNRVRYSMNSALIAIGMRNATLERKAIAAARRIGPIEVDHGETGCKTPDPIPYIQRAKARKKKTAGKKSKAKKT